MPQPFRIRVVSPWFGTLELDDAYLSTEIPLEEADALLCDWGPSEEMQTFPRRKAWYCCEPACQFSGLGGGKWPALRRKFAPDEFLCHNHPDPRCRVPHVTHFQPLLMNDNRDRMDKAVAIVSNHGGAPWRRHADLSLRAGMVVHPRVDLFGRSGWRRFRKNWWSRPAAPQNYRGELPGDWPAAGKRELMARYKVAVCLENMSEPWYFTEKFVEAVCAGCIPVYRAHPTVAGTVLNGARWIDPQEYRDDPEATIQAALAADVGTFQEQNREWLQTPALAATHHRAVFARIASILQNSSIAGLTSAPATGSNY